MSACRERGLTIIEALVGIVLLTVIVLSLMPLFASSMTLDAESRQRARAIAAAETWLDRYRNGLEPLSTTGPCTSTDTVVTCTYPYDHDFALDTTVPSHVQDAAVLGTLMQNMRADIRAVRVRAGTSLTQWAIDAEVTWNMGGEHHVRLSTRRSF